MLLTRHSARLLFFVFTYVATSTSLPAQKASPDACGEVVAYVVQHEPVDQPLSSLMDIRRKGKDVPAASACYSAGLMVGDEIHLKPNGAITIRMLATNELRLVRHQSSTRADLTVERPIMPGLNDGLLAWFKEVLNLGDQSGGRRAVTTASRGISSGTCYNNSGRTNEPI